MNANDLSILKQFIVLRCIYCRGDGEYNPSSSSGSKRNWVFDLKKVGLNSEMMETVATVFYEKYLSGNEKVGIVSAEFSGVIIASAIASFVYQKYGKNVPQIIVRKKRKKHGTAALIEGDLEGISCGERFVFVDDIVNSGSTVRSMLKKVNDYCPSVYVTDVFALVDFEKAKEINGCKVSSVFKKSEIITDTKELLESRYEKELIEPDVLWQFSSTGLRANMGVPKSSPLIFENKIMFGSDCGVFWCLDKNTGKTLWSYDTQTTNKKGIFSSPALCLNNTAVVFGDYSGFLRVLRISDGKPIRVIKLCDWIGSSPLVIDETEIIIGTEYKEGDAKGAIVSVSIGETAKINWKLSLRNVQHASAVYSKEFDKIITGSNDGICLCLNRDGSIHSMISTGGAIKYHPAVSQSICAFGSFDGNIYVWDFIENRFVNKVPTEDIVYSQPLIYKGKIFVGSADSTFFALDLNGQVLKKFYFGEKVHASPVEYKGKIYCGCSNGMLFKICPDSLEVEAVAAFSERLTNRLVFDEDKFFVYDYLNNLYCINQF